MTNNAGTNSVSAAILSRRASIGMHPDDQSHDDHTTTDDESWDSV